MPRIKRTYKVGDVVELSSDKSFDLDEEIDEFTFIEKYMLEESK